jgi:hypothetical protein
LYRFDTTSRTAFGGVFLDHCNGYSVEQNIFKTTQSHTYLPGLLEPS